MPVGATAALLAEADRGRVRHEITRGQSREELLPEYARESQECSRRRIEFLEQSQAIPTPVGVYALWIATFRSGGGIVRDVHDTKYEATMYVYANGATSSEFLTCFGPPLPQPAVPGYDSLAIRRWMPTTTFSEIPTGYGSGSLDLLLLPNLVTGSTAPTSGDYRQGWEFGHTSVCVLRLDASGTGLIATINTDCVYSYIDVEELLATKGQVALAAEYIAAVNSRSKSRQSIEG